MPTIQLNETNLMSFIIFLGPNKAHITVLSNCDFRGMFFHNIVLPQAPTKIKVIILKGIISQSAAGQCY